MRAFLIIDDRATALTAKEVKAAVRAIIESRGKTVRQVRDLMAYEFYRKGLSYAEIGKAMGMSARAVKGALTRVENGRYGDVGNRVRGD